MSQALEDELTRLEWFIANGMDFARDAAGVEKVERTIRETKISIAKLSGLYDVDAFDRFVWYVSNSVHEKDADQSAKWERGIAEVKDIFRRYEDGPDGEAS